MRKKKTNVHWCEQRYVDRLELKSECYFITLGYDINLFRLTCMKLRIGLKNFKGVLPVCDLIWRWPVMIDKKISLTLPQCMEKCHRWSREQPQPEERERLPN